MNLKRKLEQLEYEQTAYLLERLDMKSKDGGIDLIKANIVGLFRLRTMARWKSYSARQIIQTTLTSLDKHKGK
jgi:hypothetical protein